MPFFVGSVHDFGKSDDDIILGKKCFFPIHESVVSCPTCTQKSWKVSSAAASATKMSRWNELYSGWSLCSGSTLLRTSAVWIREFVVIRDINDPTP